MKKIILVATFGVAGLVCAKTTPLKNAETKSLKSKEVKSLNSNAQKTAKVFVLKAATGSQVWIAETSCGITATTTQDWTPAQANQWLANLEANYCN